MKLEDIPTQKMVNVAIFYNSQERLVIEEVGIYQLCIHVLSRQSQA